MKVPIGKKSGNLFNDPRAYIKIRGLLWSKILRRGIIIIMQEYIPTSVLIFAIIIITKS